VSKTHLYFGDNYIRNGEKEHFAKSGINKEMTIFIDPNTERNDVENISMI
jgi:hypothetical protein